MSSTSSSDDYEETFQPSTRALKWMALGMEVLGGLLVTAIALYLRFAHLNPVVNDLNWKQLCNDNSLNAKQATNDNSTLLYVIILVIPTAFIFIGELEFALFSKKSYFDDSEKKKRIRENLPRIIRIFAMFFVGVMLASFTADYLKIIIAQPRPYFLTVYGTNCPLGFNGTKTDDFYEALKSFPCHLASVAGFTCAFAVRYAHGIRTSHSTPLLAPVMAHGFLVLALTTSLDRYTSNFSHTSDIIAGLFIGLVLAFYMGNLLVFVLKVRATSDQRQWPNFLNFVIPRASMPPNYSAEATNSSRIKGNSTNV